MKIQTLFAAGKIKLIAATVISIVLGAGLITYLSAKKTDDQGLNPAFNAYVTAYTGGVISRASPIEIRFVSEIAKSEDLNKTVEKELFDFSPSIKGTTMWIDKSTIRFQPEENLDPNTEFKAEFEIGELMKMPEDLKTFNFNFQTIPQTFDVIIDGIRTGNSTDLEIQELHGTLSTSDVAENADVEKIVKAAQNGKSLNISWTHDTDKRSHSFKIDSVIRKEEKGKVTITWDGSAIMSETKGETDYEIPALGDFILISARPVQGEEQYAELQFSDPILPNQDLTGLITIAGVPDLRLVVDENIIRAFPPVRQIGMKSVIVHEGVKNINNKRFPQTTTVMVNFEEIKPSVRLIGKGVILPSTDGLVFPFEAVSLRAVNVKVLKVFENNVTQFFQVNNFEGDEQLQRVGKVILNKNISLQNTNPNDYTRWKKYYLDLSQLINTEPGAIYQIKLSFKKKDVVYECKDQTTDLTSESGLVENDEEEEEYEVDEYSNWDYSEGYYNEDYKYEERDNPCSNSYYGERRSVKRNIFASDLGIIAKIGTSGNMHFVVTDLKTTQPVSGATIEIYDYQQQIIKTETTNGDGMSSIELRKKPFFLMVKKDKQIGYLKLDNYSVLPISNFDVAGVKVQKGIKGFLYGERGVWRPGDSLYLTFILEDKLSTLPQNQPVSFELVNPLGQTTKRLVSGSPVHGFYNFSTSTADDDPTGNWMAKIKVGGADFTYPIKIETVVPNRLKIKVDFGTDKITATDSRIKGSLDVKWLHGAVAKNLDADISMQLLNAETKFPKFTEFVFDDPSKNYTSESIEIFKGSIDEKGHANINAPIEAQGSAPGILTANFKVKVMEEGGAFSVDRFSIPYYPYETYTGIRLPKGDKTRNMLLTDTSHVVDIVTVDANGNPLSGRDIEVKVYKLEWKWWWDKSDDDVSAFLESNYRQPILTGNVTTRDGKGRYLLRINYPEWGRYFIRTYDKASKHSSGKVIYMDWPGWAGKSRERNQGSNTVLSFTTDKEKYNVGENVNLSIPSAANGRALVSIESGSKIIESHWVETKEGNTNFSFDATDQMAPNVYVNVTLLQPHAQTKNDLPIRMYGMVPLKVENPKTILKPVIKLKPELRPEENVTVSVSESDGRPMTYTVAVVDEGLLDLTRFKTPDPWINFYAKEALGVSTWDMYDYVIGAFGEKMDKLLSIGGDGEVKGGEKNKANRFKPVVKFMGPFRLEAGKTASHTFQMPQYVGSVRTMVVAGDPAGAYGNAEMTTPVRKPLMILATLPRVLGPEEYVALPVNVFAMTKEVKNVDVQIKANGMFEIMETGQKTVSFSEPGDEVVNFYLKVKPTAGIGKVSIVAISGKEKANTEISIEIRNPNLPQTKVIETVVEAGKEWSADYKPFGIAGTNQGILEVSNIPPINLGERLKFLVQYPYGCVEQTTSSVFPQLFVKDFVESKEWGERSEQHIKVGIERLRSFQLPEGGLAYWPGNPEVNSWGTTYAGHFMLEAEKKGFNLPVGFINQWKKYQKKVARNWDGKSVPSNYYSNTDLDQAYRLYTLALAKDPETGSMNRLREQKNLSVSAKWTLAAAYHLAGQTEVARSLATSLGTTVPQYRELDNTFGSTIRDKAMILEVMCLLNMRVKAMQLAKEISQALSGKSWLSTQETAYCLLAMSKFANSGEISSKVNFTYSVNNGKAINAVTDMKIAQVNLKPGMQPGNIKFKSNSTGPLFARVILTGTPSAGNEEKQENNLKLAVVYKNKNGKTLDILNLEQGTDFMVEVSVTNPSTDRTVYKNLSLKQVFASGWEIHNTRMDNMIEVAKPRVSPNYDEENYEEGEEGEVETEEINTEEETTAEGISIPTYRDIRDDRVYTFFDLKAGETKTFRVMLNAAYLGKFYLPAVYSEAMYDGTIYATIPGMWVEVTQTGGNEVSMNN